ncbi:hypothetical protein [Bacillus toyonensis]|uniref:hypothetical protein n=1 Tax=Bacillus toyonensis TaxID=155322 RepID=UPI000BF69715|nr:hypothetical protein [Bacillus toyonensis]PGF05223.1 hypothetical protein COM61_02050 [Bacillus toyonensis]
MTIGKKTSLSCIVVFFSFLTLPNLNIFQKSEPLPQGQIMNAIMMGKYIEYKASDDIRPTLKVLIDGEYKNLEVREETYEEAKFGDIFSIILSEDGKVKLDPRYSYKDAIKSRVTD